MGVGLIILLCSAGRQGEATSIFYPMPIITERKYLFSGPPVSGRRAHLLSAAQLRKRAVVPIYLSFSPVIHFAARPGFLSSNYVWRFNL